MSTQAPHYEIDAAAFAAQARDLVRRDLDDALAWMREILRADPERFQPSWVFEEAVQVLIDALMQAGRRRDSVDVGVLFGEAERRSRAREVADRNILEDIGRIAAALDADRVPGEIMPGAGDAPETTPRGRLTIRAPLREELPTFLGSIQQWLEPQLQEGRSGSFAAYMPEDDALAATGCFLLAELNESIVGGCAILNYDSAFAEFAPAVVAPSYAGFGLPRLLALLHILRQSFMEPSEGRLYWSAVPTHNTGDAQSLRQCGFRARSDVWQVVGPRREEPGISGHASWLAASPTVVADSFLSSIGALSDDATWAAFLQNGLDDLDVRVQLDGTDLALRDIVPIVNEVRALSPPI